MLVMPARPLLLKRTPFLNQQSMLKKVADDGIAGIMKKNIHIHHHTTLIPV
jgi:hypothetical protein